MATVMEPSGKGSSLGPFSNPNWIRARGLKVIPNYFVSAKRKPRVGSDRLLAKVYGGDKRGPRWADLSPRFQSAVARPAVCTRDFTLS